MKVVRVEGSFSSWRDQARHCLEEGVPPRDVLWGEEGEQGELFEGLEGSRVAEKSVSYEIAPKQSIGSEDLHVPKMFVELAELVSCHSNPERWGLLYQTLWRIVRKGERRLLYVATDGDISRLAEMAREVRRDLHKMRAFVRFRKVGEEESGRENFVAWFEPSHHIVRRNSAFFRKRFAGMNWSILT
ncbi:MAG: TIGR03915 family putative DNA repair protein, partial [Verrucomicrobiota bacterium]